MGHARQILASALHRQFVELDMHQLSAETAFGSNKHLYCCATDGGLIGNRIVETENSAPGHAEHHHWDATRCRNAGLAPDTIGPRGNTALPSGPIRRGGPRCGVKSSDATSENVARAALRSIAATSGPRGHTASCATVLRFANLALARTR